MIKVLGEFYWPFLSIRAIVRYINFNIKYKISTPLMMENPVKSPNVPPIAESMSTNFAALSFVTLSNVGVSKYILTGFNSALREAFK